jgi:hypothetical protein
VYDPAVANAVSDRLRRNLFPADLIVNGELIARSVRVVVLDDTAVVYSANPDRSIEEIARYVVTDPPEYSPLTNWGQTIHVETTDGTMAIARARGCGCHSPLKTMELPEL